MFTFLQEREVLCFMKILIVEDEILQLNAYACSIQKKIPDTECLKASCYVDALNIIDNTPDIDIFILDISLDDSDKYTGIDIGRHIRTIPVYKKANIIFLTGYSDAAIDTINDTHCTYFLLKPLPFERLASCIQEIMNDDSPQDKELRFPDNTGVYMIIPYDDILYLTSTNHKTILYTTDARYSSAKSFSYFLKLLPERFVRCHKSFIVNMQYVSSYDRTTLYLRLRGFPQHNIPVGRTFKNAILSSLNN